jgi:hypothetical protein
MKTFKLIPILAMLFMLNVASTCSNDDDDNSNVSQDPAPVINAVNNGTWRVTLFNDSGNVETSNFANFNFTFGPNNVLSAVNGDTTYTGTWSVTSDSSNDDSPSNDLDFNIGFAAPSNFEELTEDWNIISYTSTKIQLTHVSGGNGGTDFITFEKN